MLERVDWKIVGRILMTLYLAGNGMKKTRLSMKCNLNHKQSTMYLDLMQGLDLIQIKYRILHDNNNGGIIRLTRRGHAYYEKEIINIQKLELEKIV